MASEPQSKPSLDENYFIRDITVNGDLMENYGSEGSYSWISKASAPLTVTREDFTDKEDYYKVMLILSDICKRKVNNGRS